MEITIEYIRTSAAGEQLWAEAVVPRLAGESKGIVRFNRFYDRAAEAFLARAVSLCLPEGRYTARLCADVQPTDEGGLDVTLEWRLFRRGRVLEEQGMTHHWQFPCGWMQL